MSFLPLVRLWLWVSASASVAGWALSAAGQLNRTGYAFFFAAGVAAVLFWRKELGLVSTRKISCGKKLRRRFHRPWPLCFAALAVLIFFGGVLYPPDNYTALTYRVPRVLQWLAHGHWLWVHTPNYRMNDRACGGEWLFAPLLLFLQSGRALFLVNFLPFLLLPGLIFSAFTRLGVRARVAWQWMWLLPAGYIFILQAGSTTNDVFPTVYALAAIAFGCRAWVSRRPADLWHSLLAMALLTGAKAGNLPLFLPWFILIFPLLPLLRRRIIATAPVLLVAAVVSFLPTAILNAHYCGDWSGAILEPAAMTVKNPLVGLVGNAFQLVLDNFAPPFFPQAGWWNQHAPQIFPQALVAVSEHFDTGFFWLGELPTEDWAGLGFGTSVLLVVSVMASCRMRGRKSSAPVNQPIPPAFCRVVMLAAWAALLAYCAKSGMTSAARLIAPYYPLLLPLLLVGGAQAEIIRHRWWRALVWGNLVLAFVVLILIPGRALWPAQTILSKALESKPGQPLLVRAQKVYSVYAGRADPLAAVRPLLPPETKLVGFMGGADDSDISLWQPYGTRRVEHILSGDSAAQIRGRGIRQAVVGGFNLHAQGTTIEDWLQRTGAELIATTNATMKVSEGLQSWYVVRFQD